MFGEHLDYLGLPVIAAAISRRVAVTGRQRPDRTVAIDLPDIDSSETFTLPVGRLPYVRSRDYFRSAFNVLLNAGLTFSGGIDAHVHGNIPINSGTSSSSALLVSWLHLLLHLSDQHPAWDASRLAELAYAAEVQEFNESGGMMDHYATAVGNVIYLESTPAIRLEVLKPAFGPFVLGDSLEPKDTQGGLSRVRNAVNSIVAQIQGVNPMFSLLTATDTEASEFKAQLSKEDLHLLKGTLSNRDLLSEALSLLRASDLNHAQFGMLLSEHHRNLREAQRISTPKIERMLDSALHAGAMGGKINGSGGGGCMFVYAPYQPEAVAEAIEKAGGKSYLIEIEEGTKTE